MHISLSFVGLFLTHMPETELIIVYYDLVFNIRTQSPIASCQNIYSVYYI